MEWIRFVVVITASLTLLPFSIPVVKQAVHQGMVEAELAWWNPGNLVGTLVSYAAASLLVTGFASVGRRIEFDSADNRRKAFYECVWWMGVTSGFVILYCMITYWATRFVNAQFAFLLAVSVSALGAVQVTRIKFPEYPFDSYIQGVRLSSSRNIKRQRGKRPLGCLLWGADYIDIEDEPKHCLLLGNVGGGKSTFFKMLMALTAHRPELWIVFDPKTELVPVLSVLGKKLLILNPFDTRSVAWDLSKDIVNPALAEALALMVIPVNENDSSYWSNAARNILIAVIKSFIAKQCHWDFRDIILVCNNVDDLRALLLHDPNNFDLIQVIDRQHSGGGNDYLLTLNTYLRKFHVIASLWNQASEKFSITELIQAQSFDDVAIVLGADFSEGETVNEINRLIFERITQLILDLPDDRTRRIKLWLDEVSEASRYLEESLVKFLTLARSKGGCGILGTQNYAGLVDQFGEHATKQILGIPHHKAVLGGVDGHTAEWFSREVVGNVDTIEKEVGYSETFGSSGAGLDEGKRQKNSSDGVSPSFRRVSRPVVPPEELLDSQIPSTGPNHGLTGFFAGGKGGFHWHHYEWSEIEAMQVKPDENEKAYDRIDERSQAYYLTPWSLEERKKWGLPPSPNQFASANLFVSEALSNTLSQTFPQNHKR